MEKLGSPATMFWASIGILRGLVEITAYELGFHQPKQVEPPKANITHLEVGNE